MNEPYAEYQVQFIERQINTLGANIEKLYDEQAEGLKALKQDVKHDIKQEIQQAYLYIGDTINTVIGEMHKITNPIAERTERIEARIERIEATMATKDDISALKDTQDAQSKRMDAMDSKLDQILQLLQAKQ